MGTQPGVVRSSFTVAAIAAPALKTIALPENLPTKPESRHIQYLAEFIREHFAGCGGTLPLFGPIVGYRFVNQYDQSILFDSVGNVIERVNGHFAGPGGAIRIGRKTVKPTVVSKMFGRAAD
jgi:hypothetical protein